MKIVTEIARFGLKIMFNLRHKFKYTYTNFDPKRDDPYFLIFNHAQLDDALYLGMALKKYPYPVASNLLYTNPMMGFGLKHVVKSIPKRKGQSDMMTIRMILDAFNKDRNGIMIAPEGNSSFFGKETKTDYIPTAKLVRKLKKDLVIAKINGGYFAKPRWGELRKRSVMEIEFKRLIKGEDFVNYSVEEVAKIMEDAIKFNDYEWILDKDYVYKDKNLAEGMERYLYACPECGKLQTISTKGNDIYCDVCGHIGHVNEKQYIEGKYQTMIDWDVYQKQVLDKHLDEVFKSTGQIYELDLYHDKRHFKGDYSAIISKNGLDFHNEIASYHFEIEMISGLTLTQHNKISFDYGEETFMIRMKDAMLVLDFINKIKGEDK